MKIKISSKRPLIILIFLSFTLSSYNQQSRTFSFKTIKIGTQIWMTSNLNVCIFRNGDTIPEAKTNEAWAKAGKNRKPAWCYYDNDTLNGGKYGKLYNWYAVNDKRGLAPQGYHVPSLKEWDILKNYLGENAGIKMKDTICWLSLDPNKNIGTNSSSFSALPTGYRGYGGDFNCIKIQCSYWSSTEHHKGSAWAFNLTNYIASIELDYIGMETFGNPVRCIKD